MKKYRIIQLQVPPESRHDGIGLISTDDSIMPMLLDEAKRVLPNSYAAKLAIFTPISNSIAEISTGRFTGLSNKDTSIGWLFVKILSEMGSELFSTAVDGGFTSLFFRQDDNVESVSTPKKREDDYLSRL